MNTLRTLSMLSAVGLLSAVSAQTLAAQGAQPATPPAAATPPSVNPEAGANERAAGKEKQIAGDTKPKDKLVGLPVETPSGQPIGSVVDIVRDRSGNPTYAVVAIDNDTTAVPYETASAMVRDDKVVMSPTRLANAPKVKQTEWLDQTSSKWRTEADRYWGTTRTATPGTETPPKER
jgi:hypothetical protein